MTTTNTQDNLLGLDDAAETSDMSVVPEAELASADQEVLDMNQGPAPDEVYDVVDQYPEVQLPQSTLDAISCNESLWDIQHQIDYLAAELETAQNKLRNQIMTLQNEAKQKLIDAQKAADESLVLNALEQPEMMSILASVLRIMQQHGKAGILLEALETIENGNATSAMSRLATAVAPVYHTPGLSVSGNDPAYEPSTTAPASQESYVQEEVVQPIKTTAAPAAKTKWKP